MGFRLPQAGSCSSGPCICLCGQGHHQLSIQPAPHTLTPWQSLSFVPARVRRVSLRENLPPGREQAALWVYVWDLHPLWPSSCVRIGSQVRPPPPSCSLQATVLCAFWCFSLSSQDLELGSRTLLQLRYLLVPQTPETLSPPPFLPCPLPWGPRGAPASGLGEGLTCPLDASMERQWQRMKRRS